MPRSLLRILASALASSFACLAAGADTAPEPARINVAQSAQLSVEAAESHDSVTLWIRRATGDKKLIDGKDVTVTIAGKNQILTQRTDGSYTLSSEDLRGKEAKPVQLIVGHDGIHELLDGQLPPPPEESASGFLGGHNQLAWWIINIGVVLIGVIALSRRKSY